MNRNVRLGILVLSALCVVACVTQIWKVKYAVEGSAYTEARALAIGTDGRIVIVGNAGQAGSGSEGDVFVASFDARGTLLWEHLLPSEVPEQNTGLVDDPIVGNANSVWEYLLPFGANRLLGTVVMDENNNTYFAKDRGAEGISIYKFDDQGVLQHSWVVYSGDLKWVDELRLGADGNLYLSVEWGQAIYAFSPEGDLLWQHAALHESNSLMEGSFAFLPSGNTVHVAQDVLSLLSPDGAIVSQQTAQSVGVEAFSNMVEVQGNLMGIGLANSSGAKLLEFDQGLAVVKSFDVGEGADFAHVSVDGADVCAVLTDIHYDGFFYEPTSVEYALVHYNAQAEVMVSTKLELQSLSSRTVAANKACYVGEPAYGKSQARSRIVRHDVVGQSSESFVIQNTYLGDFRVVGKDVIQVGFTGEYEAPSAESFLRRHRWP